MNSVPSTPSYDDNSESLALSSPISHPNASSLLVNQKCHIDTLPIEVLLKVFSFLNPGDVFDPSAAQWVVSCVCRRWYEVALMCYDLWRSITITVSDFAVWCPDAVGLLREVVARSGEHPLHIMFDMNITDMTSEDFGHEIYYDQDGKIVLPFFDLSLRLLSVLMEVSPRWVSVDLRGLAPSCAKALDAVGERLPRLEALTLDCDDRLRVRLHGFYNAPRLRAACIDYTPVPIIDTRLLVSLVSMSCCFDMEMLSECPKLESLMAHGIIPSSRDAGRRRTLDSITHISLGHDDELRFLDLPNLVELELAKSILPEHTLTEFFKYSRCPLQKLSLFHCKCDCLLFLDILRLTPRLEKIVIQFDDFISLYCDDASSSEDSDFEDENARRVKAYRRKERGLRDGLTALMRFMGVMKKCKSVLNPPLSLPYLRRLSLLFARSEPRDARLLERIFSELSLVKDFLRRDIVLSLEVDVDSDI